MTLHSRDAITVFAAVATRSRADCSSVEGHTSLSTALVGLSDVIISHTLYRVTFTLPVVVLFKFPSLELVNRHNEYTVVSYSLCGIFQPSSRITDR